MPEIISAVAVTLALMLTLLSGMAFTMSRRGAEPREVRGAWQGTLLMSALCVALLAVAMVVYLFAHRP